MALSTIRYGWRKCDDSGELFFSVPATNVLIFERPDSDDGQIHEW